MSLILIVTRCMLMVLPVVYMGFIWYFSSRPSHSVIDLGFYDSFIKESLHLVEFAILYLLWVLALLARGRLTPSGNRFAIILSVAYAFIDEFHQSFIPSRSASAIDLVKDMAGIAVVWYWVSRAYFREDDSKTGKFLRGIMDRLSPKEGAKR